MTVKELIEALTKFPDDMPVGGWDYYQYVTAKVTLTKENEILLDGAELEFVFIDFG